MITTTTDFMPDRAKSLAPVAWWLGICCLMVIAMMVIGAITRLTDSGLSIVEWRVLTGTLPPLSEAEWQRVFGLYKRIPEYRQVNAGMSLAQFKTIFWWEYIHRLWGRLIGIVFFVPFVWFLIDGRVRGKLALWLLGAFVLGGFQGVMGWHMVRSGLADRVDVSQYRLTAHLFIAFAILGYLLWMMLDVIRRMSEAATMRHRMYPWALGLSAWLSIVICTGGFVAGIDAGLVHNQFPLMGGSFLPEDYRLDGLGFWANAFESHAAAQFHHRWLAMGTGALVLAFCWMAWRADPPEGARAPIVLSAFMVVLQAGLGIATLLSLVWLPLAAAHQAGAAALFALMVWLTHRLRHGPAS